MIYQLSYELKTPDKDYTGLYLFLEKEMGGVSIHVLRDTWWIKYDEEQDINSLCDKIKEQMGENDVFYLAVLSANDINGWLPSSNWKWLKE